MMQALVLIALRRPYTFIVLALLLVLLGALSVSRTPTDIFPDVKIPVIAVAWQYSGLPPDQMAGRITTPFQRALASTVNNIEHIEATSYTGFGIVKIYFHPGVDVTLANAQVTAVSQTLVRQMPAGTMPPFIINYSASTVPVLQLALSGEGLSEQQLADLGMNQLRSQLVTVQGAAIPWPFGGKTRQIQLDLNPIELNARGLTAQDVATALATQNLVTPAGTQKIGEFEYSIQLNSAPSGLADIAAIPLKTGDGAVVRISDIAHVRDGSAVQTNIVHVDGNRSVLMSIYKNGNASTLDVIDGIKAKLLELRDQLPPSLEVKLIGDQSMFVRSAVNTVIIEGVIAAALTSLMILLFLGSLRSTLIVTLSIPLSILGALAGLAALGHTLNMMTLGGLALAVGLLVDEATVTIESINTQLEQGKDVRTAILDGSMQIAGPAFISLLCICIVFVPMYLLKGLPFYLFVPMAEAVMLAMVWSFVLSRTLVPTLAQYWLKPHSAGITQPGVLMRWQHNFDLGFQRFRHSYSLQLNQLLQFKSTILLGFICFVFASGMLTSQIGRIFFPQVDGGQILLHARSPIGTRVEETAAKFAGVQQSIRSLIPAAEIDAVVDNVGTYISSMNTIYANTGMIGSQDGDIQISLTKGHQPTEDYVALLRQELPRLHPDMTFSFLPADIVSQILNFGAPSPIDIQIRGTNLKANFDYARQLLSALRQIPGLVDVRIQQANNAPVFAVEIDRVRAAQVGLTPRDITNSLAVTLTGSGQVAPAYWLNPQNNVIYPMVMQTPQYQLTTLDSLNNLPVNAAGATFPVLLGSVATLRRTTTNAVVAEYNIQPLVQIYATTQDRDLAAVARDIEQVIHQLDPTKPKGSTVILAGQVSTMQQAFQELGLGLLGAIVLIYLVLVVHFQSWRDPLIIISALPAALVGIVWLLFATGTAFSVPALTGTIMAMGVATANSVLMVSRIRELQQQALAGSAGQALVEAAASRLRPVLMTAFAMMIGMLPMALALGEGAEQNAPLGLAVIGGLAFATLATLFMVPLVYAVFHSNSRSASVSASTENDRATFTSHSPNNYGA